MTREAMSATETTNINDRPFVYIAVCIYLRNRQAFQEKFTFEKCGLSISQSPRNSTECPGLA